MAAKTTIKVATLTGAAKDDLLTASATGLTQDTLFAHLDVLRNDPGSAKIFSLHQSSAESRLTGAFPVVTSVTLKSGATISINSDGTIAYDASTLRTSLQSTAAGQIFTDTFEYTVRMANGALSTARATVEIAGVNDAPILAAVDKIAIQDELTAASNVTVQGALSGADVDDGAVLTYRFADDTVYTVDVDGSLVSVSDYGTIKLNAATGAYEFVAIADKVDALGAGKEALVRFSVQVNDEHGAASGPVSLQFNVIGANDTATISGTADGSVDEDGTLVASGKLTITDRDTNESVFSAPINLAGQYGNFTFDVSTGEWTYTLANDSEPVQSLAVNQTVVDTLVVTSFDGSALETIKVNVTGRDEAPVQIAPVQMEQKDALPVNGMVTYKVNHGGNELNGAKNNIIKNFDSNDRLTYTSNYEFLGLGATDFGNDGTMDSFARFKFETGGVNSLVEVVLIGYTGLTDAQIVSL